MGSVAGREKRMERHIRTLFTTLAVLLLCSFALTAEAPTGDAKKQEIKRQTACPVMGGKINKSLYVVHNGKRIYVCCAGCIASIKKNPDKYIKALEEKGITLDRAPVALCHKCGEIKGAAQCCNSDAKKCSKCGLNNGSIGCCKDLKPPAGKQEIVICPKCGELKDVPKCCKPDTTKCAKCGLNTGSPACCKVPTPSAGKTDVVICPGCGEVKSTAECCKPNAQRCPLWPCFRGRRRERPFRVMPFRR